MTKVRNARRVCALAGLVLVFGVALGLGVGSNAWAQQQTTPAQPAEPPPTATAPADPAPGDKPLGPRRPSHEQDRSGDPWDIAPDCPYRERDLQRLVTA